MINVRKERGDLGQVLHVSEGSPGHSINNLIPVDPMAQMTRTNSLKDSNAPNLLNKKQITRGPPWWPSG